MALYKDVILSKPQPRAHHDLSRTNKFTASPGVLYPCFVEEALPGDTFHIGLNATVDTYPLLAPLMSTFRVEVAFFFVPTRLYTQSMDINRVQFDPSNTIFPTWTLPIVGVTKTGTTPPSSFSISRQGVLGEDVPGVADWIQDGLGVVWKSSFIEMMEGAPVGQRSFGVYFKDVPGAPFVVTTPVGSHNATPLIGFWDCVRTYYLNTQETNFYVCQGWTDGTSFLYDLPLTGLDDFMQYFVGHPAATFTTAWSNCFSAGTNPLQHSIGLLTITSSSGYGTNNYVRLDQIPGHEGEPGNVYFRSSSGGLAGLETAALVPLPYSGSPSNPIGTYRRTNNAGLPVRTYAPDMFTAWLSSSTYNDMVQSSAINIQNNTLTINQIRFGSHLLDYFERGILGGGRTDDWVYTQFGVRCNRNLCIPELLGVSHSTLTFQDIVNQTTAEGANATQSGLGGVGSRGFSALNGYHQTVHVDEHGYLIGIFSLTPRVSYGQGVNPLYFKTNFQDLYAPSLAQIGFQTLPVAYLNSLGDKLFNLGSTDLTGSPYGIQYPVIGSQPGQAVRWDPLNLAIGYQPAWTEYTTAVDRVHGDLTPIFGDLAYWSVTRDFSQDRSVPRGQLNPVSDGSYQPFGLASLAGSGNSFSYSSYVNPAQFSYAFANNAPDAQNFIVQLLFHVGATRRLGKSPMPTLA